MKFEERVAQLMNKSMVASKGAELCHQTMLTAAIIAKETLNNPTNEEILEVYKNLVDSEREVGLSLTMAMEKKVEREKDWKAKGLA